MTGLPADTLDIQKQLLSRVGLADAVNSRSGIALEYAIGLYRAVLTKRPKTMLEIGMANGAATLAILSALSQLDGERLLISIDPNQSTQWHNAGVNNVKANGFSGMHRLIEEPDYVALPELLRQQLALDAAYVDGWHTFDYVLLDFFYIDKLLPVGGLSVSMIAAGAPFAGRCALWSPTANTPSWMSAWSRTTAGATSSLPLAGVYSTRSTMIAGSPRAPIGNRPGVSTHRFERAV
jgi:Methyltransferase domain